MWFSSCVCCARVCNMQYACYRPSLELKKIWFGLIPGSSSKSPLNSRWGIFKKTRQIIFLYFWSRNIFFRIPTIHVRTLNVLVTSWKSGPPYMFRITGYFRLTSKLGGWYIMEYNVWPDEISRCIMSGRGKHMSHSSKNIGIYYI